MGSLEDLNVELQSLQLLPAQEWGEWERESHPWFFLSPIQVWTTSTTTSWKEPQAFSPFRLKGSDSSCWNLSLACSTHCPPPTFPQWPCLLSFAEVPEDLQHSMAENVLASGFRSPQVSLPTLKADKGSQIPFWLDWGGWPPWVPTLVVFTGRKRKLLCNGEPCKMSVVNSGAGFSWLVLHIRYALHSTKLTKAPSPLHHVASPLQIASIQIIRLALKKNSIFNTLTGPSVCSLSWSIRIHITACTRAAGSGPTTVLCSHSFTLPHVPDKMTLSLVQGATVVVTFIFWFFYWAQTSFSKWASLI